jgi:peptidoglycan-associated lipoprotein
MGYRRIFSVRLVSLVVAALAIGGCQSTPKASETASGSGSGMGGGSDVQEVTETPVPELRTVYFDFDKYDIRADARPILKANADMIRNNPDLGRVTLQGNCDERGSEEYNIGLGERRANAVKRYLVDLGVPAARLDTVSFGEMKPAVMGHDESAWRWNRRVDFAVPR